MASILDELQAGGTALFTQRHRLLTLRFSKTSGIPHHTLLPQTVRGEEALSRCYRYTLDCLSADAFTELKELLGQPVEIALRLSSGGERLLTGLVTRVESLGGDGGFARFRLTVEPALATLVHRHNSRVFQDLSVVEIVQTILDEHRATNRVFAASFRHQAQLTQPCPPRSYCLQYRESDLAFIERLLAEEGISYRFTHGTDSTHSIRSIDARRATADGDDDTPLHTLILFDAGQPPVQASTGTVLFHRTDGVEIGDAIDRWESSRQLQSEQTSLLSYDYKSGNPYLGSDATGHRPDEHGAELATGLEDYDPQTFYYGSDPDDIARYARLRQLAKNLAGKAFSGAGSARALEVGSWFDFLDHPVHDQDAPEDRQFLVTELAFEAHNNLLPEEPARLAGGAVTAADTSPNPPAFRNTFNAVRRHVPIVPTYQQTRHQKPTAQGSTTAIVVGPAGEEIFTDQLGRIKIQFHWQRPQDHPGGGADFDDRSSSWVRVMMPCAGTQWGSQYIPRVGQEVVVDFVEGDIDRPLVTGVVHNGSHPPPQFSGAGQLPANKTLSGHKSKEYRGNRYNELLFDDSTGQLRTKLSSEHGKTQLNQGYLIHPRSNGKGEPRGEGFELRTDHHGAIRAAHGLLLSTEAQAGANGPQLARELARGQLNAAHQLAKSLGEVAARQSPDPIAPGGQTVGADHAAESGHLGQHVEALKAWEAGSNTDREGKSAGRQPIIALAAPAGIAHVTAQNHTTAAGANIDQVAQRDINQTSGRRWLHNVGQQVSLFVNGVRDKLALKLIAAQGKVQIQAQQGEIELTSAQALTLTSSQQKIRLAAGQEVLLTSGGAYVRIKDGQIELHCPGTISIKGANHQWSGPASTWVNFPEFPVSGPTQHSLRWKVVSAVDGRPITATDVISMSSDKSITSSAQTGRDGRSAREFAAESSEERVALVGSGEWVVDLSSEFDPVALDRDEDTESTESKAP